ncbi:hypothetical protein DENSPDRAFT_763553, partial [Dentipellis sp. KUC8613]
DSGGVRLGYIDSGVPAGASSRAPTYPTIFVVHGGLFTSTTFLRLADSCYERNIRLVALNRRSYPSSTPLAPPSFPSLTSAAKRAWLAARGVELLQFIDAFIERERLPPISRGGEAGGVALVGVGIGAAYTCAAVASMGIVAGGEGGRVGGYLRAHILQEPPPSALGLPTPAEIYTPLNDTALPSHTRLGAHTLWVTSYFSHRDIDLSSHDRGALECVLPALTRVPTAWRLDTDAGALDDAPYDALEAPLLAHCARELRALCEEAMWGAEVSMWAPALRRAAVCGDMAPAEGVCGFWALREEDRRRKGSTVWIDAMRFVVVPGGNHLMQWDEPEKTVDGYVE